MPNKRAGDKKVYTFTTSLRKDQIEWLELNQKMEENKRVNIHKFFREQVDKLIEFRSKIWQNEN